MLLQSQPARKGRVMARYKRIDMSPRLLSVDLAGDCETGRPATLGRNLPVSAAGRFVGDPVNWLAVFTKEIAPRAGAICEASYFVGLAITHSRCNVMVLATYSSGRSPSLLMPALSSRPPTTAPISTTSTPKPSWLSGRRVLVFTRTIERRERTNRGKGGGGVFREHKPHRCRRD